MEISETAAAVMVIAMMLIILAALISCFIALLIVRFKAKRAFQRKIKEQKEALERAKARTASKYTAPSELFSTLISFQFSDASPYVMTPNKKLRKIQQDKAVNSQCLF
jgi:uncharacterized membrane-anchored protein YhcB (DUF1043 family)